LRRFQGALNPRYVRMRATEVALHDPCRRLEGRHGLAEISERGTVA
jgi:hypothetical protein